MTRSYMSISFDGARLIIVAIDFKFIHHLCTPRELVRISICRRRDDDAIIKRKRVPCTLRVFMFFFFLSSRSSETAWQLYFSRTRPMCTFKIFRRKQWVIFFVIYRGPKSPVALSSFVQKIDVSWARCSTPPSLKFCFVKCWSWLLLQTFLKILWCQEMLL